MSEERKAGEVRMVVNDHIAVISVDNVAKLNTRTGWGSAMYHLSLCDRWADLQKRTHWFARCESRCT